MTTESVPSEACDFVLDGIGTTCDKQAILEVIVTVVDEYDEGYELRTWCCEDHAEGMDETADLIGAQLVANGAFTQYAIRIEDVDRP